MALSDLMPSVDDGPPPMAWADYHRRASKELKELLESGPGEGQMQGFLERHPPLVPGAFPEYSGHGGWPSALITQPVLKGFGHRVPDFMWITRNSGEVRPVMIEIEDPHKPWLVGDKEPRQSHQLTQALNQFRQWSEWLEENREVFFKSFGIPLEWSMRRFRPQYLLIYGRKGENPEEITKLRQHLQEQSPSIHLLTYDHLVPIRDHESYICIKGDGIGRYEAVAMPATARLTPNSSESWKLISGRQQMVQSNDWITAERKEFLADYLKRCDEWAAAYDDVSREVFARAREDLTNPSS